MAQERFQRVEKKYLVTERQLEMLMPAIQEYMQPDRYTDYSVLNLYFDNENYTMFRTSIDKPCYKEKLRLRSYGIPSENSPVYLEIKKKYCGIVYKRRTELTLAEAVDYIDYDIYPREDSQIMREIDYMKRFYDCVPRAMISYRRQAFCGISDPELRLTLDTDLRGRNRELDLAKGNHGDLIIPDGRILMEVKIPGALPMWMADLFTECGLVMVSFSKIGTYYREYLSDAYRRRSQFSGLITNKEFQARRRKNAAARQQNMEAYV